MLGNGVIVKTRILSCATVAALTLGLLPESGEGAPPPGYYDSADMTSSAALRATLHEIIDDHTWFPYTSSSTDTWDILETAQEDPNNPSNILDVYRNKSYDKIGGGSGPYNREHSWPKSYGFPDYVVGNYPYTDCYQLFLCDTGYNSSRGNKPFRYCSAACSEKTTDVNNGQGGGSGTYPGNSNWTSGSGTQGTWETWIGRRGDIARAQFYLDVRYEGGSHGTTGDWEPDLILTNSESLIQSSSTGDNEPVAYMGMLSALLQWHVEDPVDDWERDRNDVVSSYQGNRNPFIDHPEWVECIFDDECGCGMFNVVVGSGDVNGDEFVDGRDIGPFVEELLNPTAPSPTACRADMDANGDVEVADIPLFVNALIAP
jgi:endonuclease I